ncbi:hypothetical protein A0O34_03225 [Chryseobacterium glaciei]|uniref:Peptidase S74 domain-containing protein n=1 Tax=Chryseobacterium glaciei TaxID=1685010 RepID=A0A172XRF9_9FLAO|nr:hypothetical protein [Chryseobacterium glaciei]ANF49617.1 hypothetical protein A0O34_03225 [Chryseobacterium glaciei]
MKKTTILIATVLGFVANAQSWNLTGNGATSPTTNFLGTTDNQPLVFKTNNIEWMKINTKGRLIFQNIDSGSGLDNNLFLGGGNDNFVGFANTSVGIGALVSNIGGGANTAVGANSLRANISGGQNTAIGVNANANSTIATANTAVGGNAINGLGTSKANTAVGFAALARYNATVNDNIENNTAIGYGAMSGTNSGVGNSALGKRALSGVSSGNNNIGIGIETGNNIAAGNENIVIGNNLNVLTSGGNNQLNIGNWIIGNNGTIGIGQFTNQLPADGVSQDGEKYKLFVKDGIRTEKVKVDIASSNGWADYVFEKGYKLMPLNDLQKFIDKNGHLPEVPTTEQAIQNGIELKEMNILLLKKVEELTLHLIEQNKELIIQKEEIQTLKKEIRCSK